MQDAAEQRGAVSGLRQALGLLLVLAAMIGQIAVGGVVPRDASDKRDEAGLRAVASLAIQCDGAPRGAPHHHHRPAVPPAASAALELPGMVLLPAGLAPSACAGWTILSPPLPASRDPSARPACRRCQPRGPPAAS